MRTPSRSEQQRSGLVARKNRSLLERIRADDLEEELKGSDPVEVRIASIRGSLISLLNSRAGFAESAVGYGLEDLNDASVGSSDMLRIIARDIERAIAANEPRVTNVRVGFDRAGNRGAELNFFVSASTKIERASQQLTIDLVLTDGRSFSLR